MRDESPQFSWSISMALDVGILVSNATLQQKRTSNRLLRWLKKPIRREQVLKQLGLWTSFLHFMVCRSVSRTVMTRRAFLTLPDARSTALMSENPTLTTSRP